MLAPSFGHWLLVLGAVGNLAEVVVAGGVIDYIALGIVCVVLYIETDPAIIPKRPFAEL